MIVLNYLIALAGSWLTQEFAKHKSIGVIRSSCLLTLFFSIDLYLFNKFVFAIEYEFYLSLFFGATFIGMSSVRRLPVRLLLISNIVYVLLIMNFAPLMQGAGGTLGFCAFISVLISQLLRVFFKEEIKLRSFQDSDLEFAREMLSNINVVKTTGFKVVQTDEQINHHLKEWQFDKEVWCVTENSRPIGWGMLKFRENQYEIGYMIPERLWELGYGTKVVKTIVSENREKELFARVSKGNFASMSILKKFGFKKIKEDDDVIYFFKD